MAWQAPQPAPPHRHDNTMPVGSAIFGFIERPDPQDHGLGAIEEQPVRIEDDPEVAEIAAIDHADEDSADE